MTEFSRTIVYFMPYFTYFVGVMLAVEDILGSFNKWKFRETLPDDAHKKVSIIITVVIIWCCFRCVVSLGYG